MADTRLAFLKETSSQVPIETTFRHESSEARGEVAMQYWPRRDGSSAAPESLTLFILGNPGLLNYYIPFLNHLHGLLPASHAILSTSHIGHSPHLQAPNQSLDLLSQLEAKAELTRCLRTSLDFWADEEAKGEGGTQRPRLNLMGHSVGAWMACEVMKKLPEEVDAGLLLFPTLAWIADSWNGRTMWPIFQQPFKSLLPMLSPFLRPVLPLTTFPPTTLSLLRSSTTIGHVIDLAVSEMATIKEPDLEWYRSQGSSCSDSNIDSSAPHGLYAVYSAGNIDGWVGREGPLIRECLGGEPGGRVEMLEGVPHAFCLTQANSEVVAKTVASWFVGNVRTLEETGQSIPGGSVLPM